MKGGHAYSSGIKSFKIVSNFILKLVASMARMLPLPIIRAIYRITPIANTVRSGLNRVAPRGLVQVRIAAGELMGMRMELDLQLEKDYWLGTYEPELMAAINDFVEPGMIAYDLGANVGYVTLMLANKVGCKGHVYAFEALPENVERLRSNISLNGMEGYVTLQALAVASQSGWANFLIGPSIGMGKLDGSAGREQVVYLDSISVESVSLDDFVYLRENRMPDVVKIDIEGGETLALLGMERILDEVRPVVLLELHGYEAVQVAWERFYKANYCLFQMKPGLPQVYSIDELDWKTYLIAKPG